MIWDIRLLGGLAVHGAGRSGGTRLRTQRGGALLACLALNGGPGRAPFAREHLCGLLWPDADEGAARHNLSSVLTVLRHTLEPAGIAPGSVIEADRDAVRLRPESFTCDAARFRRGAATSLALPAGAPARARSLADACALYWGPLLPGLSDAWATDEAARLAALFLRAAVAGAAELLRAGDAAGALALAERAAAEDPLSEEALTHQMLSLLALGEPSAAYGAFRRYERRLAAELAERPPAPIRELALRARREAARSAQKTSPLPLPAADPTATVTHDPPTSSDQAAVCAVTATRFFGRQAEIARLSGMLAAPRSRLVTLTGPGGTGKTRLALETAARWEAGHPGGPRPVFVPLADVTEASQIPAAVLRALGVVPAPNTELKEQVASVLKAGGEAGRLLVLDNFEHLAAEGASEVTALLAQTPAQVRFLVTSRVRLRVTGEQEFRLAPLSTTGGERDPAIIVALPAVALFVDRAQMARHEFELTDGNASDVATLVDRLEGVPLAIELAAARTGILSPARMLAQLDARPLDALSSPSRDAAPRHRSLRATLEWSYGLLPPEAQRFLADVSVFRGGWTLEAAEAVCEDADALDMLTLLRDASLVNVADDGEGIRFSLLETVRQFAQERLAAAVADAVRARHLAWCLTLAGEAGRHLTGPGQVRWLQRLETDYDNLRAALEFAVGEDRGARMAESGLRLAASLGTFWSARGHSAEGRRYLERAIARDAGLAALALRAEALHQLGAACFSLGHHAASREADEDALRLFRQVEDLSGTARALYGLGSVALVQGDYESARAYHEECLRMRRGLNDRHGVATALHSLGTVALRQEDAEAAAALYGEGLQIFREQGDRWGAAMALRSLGTLAEYGGDGVAAKELYENCLSLYRELGDRRGIAITLVNLGNIALGREDYEAARGLYEEGLRIHWEVGARYTAAVALFNLANVLVAQKDYPSASALYAESLGIRRESGDVRGVALCLHGLGTVALAQGERERARVAFSESMAAFRDMGAKELIAASLVEHGALREAESDMVGAVRLWGASEVLRWAIGVGLSPRDRSQFDGLLESARAALGEDRFAAAWQEGREMHWERAVAFALGEEG